MAPGGALLPTRAQAELVDDEDKEASTRVIAGRREEPRSVEEAGPLRVLYEGHDLLIVDKARSFWVGCCWIDWIGLG
jgi:hypothetical protein